MSTATAVELALWIAVLLPVLSCAPVRQAWNSLRLMARAATVALFVGLLAVQALPPGVLLRAGNSAYPFMRWRMYTAPTDEVLLWQLVLRHADGTESHYPLEWFDGRHPRTLLFRLRIDDSAKDRELRLQQGLSMLLSVYNSRRPERAAVALTFSRRQQSFADFTEPDRIPTEVRWRVMAEQPNATR